MSGRFHQAFLLQTTVGNDGVTPSGTQLDGTTAIAAAATLAPFPVWDLDGLSIQWTTLTGSTLVGTLTLQVSNDRGNQEQTGRPDVTLGNWASIAFWDPIAGAQATSKAVATGAASLFVVLPGANLACVYRWARLVFAFTSGTGNVKASMQQKGWP